MVNAGNTERVAVTDSYIRAPLARLPCGGIEKTYPARVVHRVGTTAEDRNQGGIDHCGGTGGGGQMAILRFVGHDGGGNLHGLILRNGLLGAFNGRASRWKDEAGQDPDDRNDHKQLNQREAGELPGTAGATEKCPWDC